ncbi:APJA protein, partial [Alopecoenas beccarii]|nr:APJA protein [Alopecoenas beccarii]
AAAMEYAEVDEYYYGEEVAGNATWEACEWQADWEASFSLLPLLYLLVFALGLSGNGLVLLTVWRGPRARRRSADAYIGNLALADLAFVATLPLWAAYTALRFHWPFGAALCKLSSFLVLLSMFASAFCLGGLSAERCRAAAPPPRAAARRRLLRLIAVLVAAFAGCWLPFHLLKSLFALAAAGLLELPCALLGLIARLHPYATCLAYLNSCLNPLLYAFLDGRFRARCRLLLAPRRPPAAAAASTLSGPTQRSELGSAGTKL